MNPTVYYIEKRKLALRGTTEGKRPDQNKFSDSNTDLNNREEEYDYGWGLAGVGGLVQQQLNSW